MADQQLIIQVQAQIGDALAQLKAVQDQVKGVGTVGAAAISPIQGLFSVLGKVAKVVGIAFTVKAIINFGKSAVDAFTKADSAARQFINTLTERGLTQANALAASNAIGGAAVASGFEPEAIQQAMSNMIVKMNSGRDATLGMQIAMDNARIKGITLATSIQSVSIAALGSLKSLRQFGITTNKDVNGNLKTANELLKEMADRTKGGLSTYMASPLGMIDRMKVSLQEMKETIGGVLTQAFAPAAQMVTGFAGAITAMASVSTVAVPPLVSLAVAGARIGKVFMDSTYVVREFFAALNPKNYTFDPMTMNFTNKATDALTGQWIDADIAYENYIRDLKNGTPEDEVNKQMKELQRLLAGVQTGADGATAAGAKTAAAWEAAFAPLKLLSGSIPNLAKYVGNLSSSFVLRSELNITIHDDTAPKGPSAPLSPSVAGAVHAAVKTSLRTATRGVVSQPASHGTHIFDGFASKYTGLPTSGSGGW